MKPYVNLDLGSYSYKMSHGKTVIHYPSQYVKGSKPIVGHQLQTLPCKMKFELSTPFSGPYPLNIEVLETQLTEMFEQNQIETENCGLKLAMPPFTPT